MNKLTKEQAYVISGFTGILCTNFSDFHGEVEKRLGRPVFTHEFPSIEEEIKEAFKKDFFNILPE